jgi:two-component system nitrogen regulation response regulator GlnG
MATGGISPDDLQAATRPTLAESGEASEPGVLQLTVASHAALSRVGERFVASSLDALAEVRISRLEPLFSAARGGSGRPLADPWLSRQPILLLPAADGSLLLDPGAGSVDLVVDGQPCPGVRRLAPAELALGVVLTLGKRLVLVLRRSEPSFSLEPPGELIGESAAMVKVREDVVKVADLDYPVLLRGETGSGKELVARAIHRSSGRTGPYVEVNIGAIPRELAVAELFGALRGSFTGADRDRSGYFRRAGGGTLFLDEIGEASPELQVALLRVLETGEVQPVGGERPQKVDVRVVAATDADLEDAVEQGRFRSPLLYRLASYEMILPPLRERREDIGRLFYHFLGQELRAIRQEEKLDRPAAEKTFVPAELVGQLLLHDWPGNVRQLRNVVRQLVVASRGADQLLRPPSLDKLLPSEGRAENAAGEAPRQEYRRPWSISTPELLAALRAERFNVHRAARRLSVSRTTLYKLMEDCPEVRKASDLLPEEVAAALEDCQGDIETAAERLQVSPRGLQLRLRELGRR